MAGRQEGDRLAGGTGAREAALPDAAVESKLVLYDDGSDPAAASRLYEKLITQDKVDLVLGPFSNAIVDAVADVT